MRKMVQHFKLALAMFAAVREAMKLTNEADRQSALKKIGPYRSRGKGGRKSAGMRRSIFGRWVRDRSKYDPRECFRRGNR